MTDRFTEFSCILPVGSADNVAPALALYQQFAAEQDAAGESIGFEVEAAHAVGGEPDALWLRDSVGAGDPEHVIAFALLCAETFSLSGRWGFVYSTRCSRHRLDGFDGSAHLLDLGRRETVAWVNCEHWLALQLAADEADAPSMEAELLALLKEPAQPMGLSECDFRHWLPRAQAAIARAETTPRPPAGGTRPASTEPLLQDAAVTEGWTTATQACVLLGFIDALAARDPGVADRLQAHLAAASAEPEAMLCRECGEPMFIAAEGTSHHAGDGMDGIDHTRDRDHVAIADEEG